MDKIKWYYPIGILTFSYLIGEMYSYWDVNDKVTHNWIVFEYVPMNTAWNIKWLTEELNRVLEAWAFLIIAKDCKSNAYLVTSKVYFHYRCLDVLFYFLTFKTKWYNWIWVALAFIELWLTKKCKEYK